MGNADIVRDLQRLTPRLGPAPSYHTVRRVAALARPSDAGMNPYLDELIVKLLTGRFPDFYAVDARLEFERYLATK